MRFACLQIDIAWENKAANHAKVERLLDAARLPAGTFAVLPELGDTGFSFDLDAIADGRTLPWARSVARRHAIWLQVGHAVRAADGRGRNCATIVSPEGESVGTYEKIHPFSYGREIEHFSGGDRIVLRRCGEVIVSPLICYDLRFPELWRLAMVEGAHVFTIGACWPETRAAHWRALVIARAIENQAYVVAVNRVGRDPHLAYAGGSMIVSPTGEILAEGGSTEQILWAEIDLAALEAWRETFPALRDVRREMLGRFAVERG